MLLFAAHGVPQVALALGNARLSTLRLAALGSHNVSVALSGGFWALAQQVRAASTRILG